MNIISYNAFWCCLPTGSGLTQCQSCLEDDSVECILDQESQICAQDREALGTTHCGSAKITYRDRSRVEDGVIRGCIDCAGTYLISKNHESLSKEVNKY